MKSSKLTNPIVVAASSVLFVNIILPTLTGLVELLSVKLNKYAVYDQVETAKVSKSIEEEPPVHAIGFTVQDDVEDMED